MYEPIETLQGRARDHQEQLLREADRERRARPPGVPRGWRDPAAWAAILGPVVGLSFLGYFAEAILRATTGR